MIERTAKETLLRLASQFPVVGVTGPRQSGKTTLARAVFPNKRYVTFDDVTMRELATSNPADFVAAFPDGAVIDEAQKVPAIFDALKMHIVGGDYAPGKFILTGSSQFRLRKNMTDSMAGRAAFLKLLPFAVTELNIAGLAPDDPYELIFKGLYPPLHDPQKHFIAADWFANYIDTYVERDVAGLINASNIATFKKFISLCALHSGQLLSMNSIAVNVGVSVPTIKSWLSILEASYIIHFLMPETNTLGKSLVKTPKMYFVDTGLLCFLLHLETKEDLLLSRYKGAVVETFAVAELLKSRMNLGKDPDLTFYRDKNGFEVDAIGDWKQHFAIEIKSTAAPESKLSANTRKYVERLDEKDARSAVFYLGSFSMTIGGVDYVSWKDWGKYAALA